MTQQPVTKPTYGPAMPQTPALSKTIDRYLLERSRRGEFSPDTKRTVGSILHRFARNIGDPPTIKLHRGHVRRWWAGLECGPSTARNQLSTVRTFLRWCVDEGLLRSDPTRTIRPPREPRRIPRTIARPAAARLVAALPDARARLIVLWMLHLGLRCGEVSRIQVGDIDRDARLLVVRGKGQRERILPIPAEAWHALLAYLEEAPATSGPLVRRYDDHSRALVPHYISDMVRRFMRDAGVKVGPRDGLSGHALRRTCATDLLDGGAHIRQVQEVLGHASIQQTAKYLRKADAVELRPVMDGRTYRS